MILVLYGDYFMHGKIGLMLTAKASEDDLQCADQIVFTLEAIERGHLPDEMCTQEIGESFDVENAAQCQQVVRHLLDVASKGSIGRAVMGMRLLFDPRSAVLAPDSDVLELHPKLVQALQGAEQVKASGWVSLSAPGQIQPGDFLSFTVGGSPVCATARQVLFAGTDREEIVYNRQRNHYFITAMALDGSSSHKDVFVRSMAKAR
ncbi:hypothetical protein KVG88_30420 [Pseudomonas sp. SWRI74]|uniref:Uncharacterized protein n=1 Tax=Pseudomonas azerbaijanoccidentalis TaxID=2842347 RepID=A0ABS6QZM7_9PSED|nr:hypothetical protein [Pseudomonas azerbaijanoccidentalis]MBV4524392.1 hypothetical protein [Pseudomonas azerbaijanoccidentalis]